MQIEELETPAIVVDLDVMEANLSRMSEYCSSHGLNLRPHIKTHKIPLIAQRQRALGSRGITVAKVGEAEVMAAAGIDDILVHYPVFGESQLDRLAGLANRCTITIALDSLETAEAVSRSAGRAGSTIQVLIELDSGMRRCGVASVADAVHLAQKVSGLAGLRLIGITTYPGHIWAQPDQQQAPLIALNALLDETADAFGRNGLPSSTVSAGSTPTARNSHQVTALTEIRPGTYVFNDRNTVGIGACTVADCALRVLVTVVSTAVKGRAIIDGGSKTFTMDRWMSGASGHGLVVEHPDLEFGSMSEEHGHVDLGASDYKPNVGDRLSVIPNHVCPCVNLHDKVHFHRQGTVEGSWTVEARGKVR